MLAKFLPALWMGLLHITFSCLVIGFSSWFCLALWIQQPFGKVLTFPLIVLWIAFSFSILGLYFTQTFFSRNTDIILFFLAIVGGLIWYFNIEPRQDRDWAPEGAQQISYQRHANHIQIKNVRNFNWHSDGSFDERWETRTYDLNQLTGVNIITSYWMGPQIAHTLVSFDFSNQKPLVFSIEIRKEKNEKFSAIGGFFRQFELSLIAADEKDILYTRSNIRHEDVYFFPIHLPKQEVKNLFLEYLNTADELQHKAEWYNTLTSNCTTLVFDMVEAINPHQLPKDYRILMSGYLPNYLYDNHVIDQRWTIKQWYQRAYLNSKTQNFDKASNQSSEAFSKLIRKMPYY